MNLVSNARDAMRQTPPPRRLTLTTRSDAAQGLVALTIADTGPGIPPEVRRRLFEPFFTTKPPGQGTGLGLSLCRGIVEGHDGTIRVESAPGQGAVFTVELPVDQPSGPEAQGDAFEAAAPVSGKTILVVDDEAEMVSLLAEMLTADGNPVETADNGATALDRLRARRYDLVLTDVRMPVLDGPGLYRELEQRDPEMCRRVVFVTGDTLSADVVELLGRTAAPHLVKPFTADEVRQAIRRVLGGPAPATG